MKQLYGKIGMAVAAGWILGCEAKATDEQLQAMCKNMLELKGTMRGTDEAKEAARVAEEYRIKEENNKKEMARDLQGMEDVRAQKMKDIEAGQAPPLSEEEAKDLTPEQIKEAQIKKAEEIIKKREKEITEEAERLLAKLGPQKEYAIRDAKKYAAKRLKEAKEAETGCIEAAKQKGVTEKVATCRAQAQSVDDYKTCQ